MTYRFDYDFIRDYQKPLKWVTIANGVGGISILLIGVLQVLSYAKNENLFYLLIGLLLILGGLSYLLFALNKNKPLVAQGQYFLKIEDQKIYFKLGSFNSRKELMLKDIKNIQFENQAIILKLRNGNETWINLHKIQNVHKKQDFIRIMKALSSTLKVT